MSVAERRERILQVLDKAYKDSQLLLQWNSNSELPALERVEQEREWGLAGIDIVFGMIDEGRKAEIEAR